MAATKALTLRLSQQLADDLETVALVDGQPMSETVRLAVTAYIDRRANEPDWPAKRDAVLARMRRLTEEPDHA